MTPLTVTGPMAQAQLFGGRLDGLTVPVMLSGGMLPESITYQGDEYRADATTRDGTPRYSRPQYAGKLTRGKEAQ